MQTITATLAGSVSGTKPENSKRRKGVEGRSACKKMASSRRQKSTERRFRAKEPTKSPKTGWCLAESGRPKVLGKWYPPKKKKREKGDGREEAISVPSLCLEVNSVVIEHELACPAKIFGAQGVWAKQWEEHLKEVNLGSFVMEGGGHKTCSSVFFCEMKDLVIMFSTEHVWIF